MERDNNEQWGNIELPGLSDDILLSPNLNKILANRAKAKILKIKNALTGKIRPQSVKEKIGKKHRGKKTSDETKQKLRKINLGKNHSDETKLKISKISRKPRRGHSAEGRTNIGLSVKNRPIYTCPHCGKQIKGMGNYNQHIKGRH